MTTLPAPRSIDPSAVPALRWGVVGAGEIASAFTRAVQMHTGQRIIAVASRSPERAGHFAAAHGVTTVHPSVDALVGDDAIDVVYIATPHPEHHGGALRAISAGKHVLVEKPFAVTRAESEEIAAAARGAGVFAMEGMWCWYNPYFDVMRQVVADGTIGDVHSVVADFGFVAPFDPTSRMWSPALGGGALLDAGVYPVSFVSSILGSPISTSASGAVASTGVDARADVVLRYPDGVAGHALTSIVDALPARAMVVGTAGRVELPAPFFAPPSLTVTTVAGGDSVETTWSSYGVLQGRAALAYEATDLASYVADGRTESPLQSLAETSEIVGILETARDAAVRAN